MCQNGVSCVCLCYTQLINPVTEILSIGLTFQLLGASVPLFLSCCFRPWFLPSSSYTARGHAVGWVQSPIRVSPRRLRFPAIKHCSLSLSTRLISGSALAYKAVTSAFVRLILLLSSCDFQPFRCCVLNTCPVDEGLLCRVTGSFTGHRTPIL